MGKVIEMVSFENVPEYTGLKNEITIEIKDGCEWDGFGHGTLVGVIYDDGTVKSYFGDDAANETTEIFDKLRNDMTLLKQHTYLTDRNTMEMKGAELYYIPYKVKNHCSDKPTVTDAYVDSCCNVHYNVEYEILLVAGEGLRKYITVEYETEGSFSACFFDKVEEIESMFEEWFEDNVRGFKTVDDGYKTVLFYDATGRDFEVEVSSVSELLHMVASIRVIKCEQKIMD